MRARRSLVLLAGAAMVGATLLTPSVASGDRPVLQPRAVSDELAQGLVGPLQIDVAGGTVYVAQNFSGVLTEVTALGRNDIAAAPGGEIGGVLAKDGTVLFTSGDGQLPAHEVERLADGATTVVADTLAYEEANNPDAGLTYGFEPALADECAALWPTEQAGPPSYPGIVDSHAYALADGGDEVYIADAGANAIFGLGDDGELRTVAVLPPQRTVISAEAAAANGMPDCVVGSTYLFESVPTDVEVGPDGALYVTTLPGGPEDPSLGARGSVYRVDPSSGEPELVATGFLGATNLAIGPGGIIYVSELFGGKVSTIVGGVPETYLRLPAPAGLEYADGQLYVSYDVFPPEDGPPDGKVGTIKLGRG